MSQRIISLENKTIIFEILTAFFVVVLIFICTIKFKNCINKMNDVRDFEEDYKKEQQLMENILKENNK